MKNEVIKKLLLLCSIILATTSHIFCALENTWHFDTSVLSNSKDVRERLINLEGFIELDINPAIEETVEINGQTTKKIKPGYNQNKSPKIKGLFLERPNARATIIFTPGFRPGIKETFTPFVKLAPQDCNLLFMELQDHGQSSGPSCCSNFGSCLQLPSCFSCLPDFSKLFSCLSCSKNSLCQTPKFFLGLKKYGLEEHKDIIGAIFHIHQQTQGKPIVLFGWCAGAFLSANTLIKLRSLSEPSQDLIQKLNIQGLIFDSGFGSIKECIPGLPVYTQKHLLKAKNTYDKFKNSIKTQLDKIKNYTKESAKTLPQNLKKLKETLEKFANNPKEEIKQATTKIKEKIAKLAKKIETFVNNPKANTQEAINKLNEKIKKFTTKAKETIDKINIPETKGFFGKIASFFGKAKKTVLKGVTNAAFGIVKLIFGRSIEKNDKKLNLYKNINTIADIKTLFIHSKLDSLAPFESAQRLANNITDHKFWPTEGDYHAKNHIKYKDGYKTNLTDWLQETIVDRQVPVLYNQNPVHQEMITIIDNLIHLLDNPTSNAQQDFQNLLEQMEKLIQNNQDQFSPEFINLFQKIPAILKQNSETAIPELKNILLQMKAILTGTNGQPINKNINNPDNKKKPINKNNQSKKNIRKMIRLIDQMIELTDNQKISTKLQQFMALLQDPNTLIPQDGKKQITQLIETAVQNSQELKNILQQIKQYLENLLDPKKDKNHIEQNQQNNSGLENTSKYKPNFSNNKETTPNIASKKNNPDSKSKKSNYSPSSNSGSSYSPSNSYPSYGNTGYNNQNGYPDYGHNDYGSAGGNGEYGQEDWLNDLASRDNSSTQNKNNSKQNTNPDVTVSDILLMDETYGPEMEDRPDRPRYFDFFN